MQKRTRTPGRTFALSLAAVVGLLLGACDDEQTKTELQQDCTDKCLGAQVCDNAVGACICQVGVNGASCSRDTDCSAGEICGNPGCQCVPSGTGGASGEGGGGGEGAGGSGGTGGTGAMSGSGGIGGTPPEFPPHTTNCLTDASGCLTTEKNSGCEIVLDDAVSDPTATIEVEGAILVGDVVSSITAWAYGKDLEFENAGYQASVTFATKSGVGGVVSQRLVASNYATAATRDWQPADGTYPVRFTAAFDQTNESAAFQLTATGAPTDALSSSAMGAAQGTQIIVTLKDATACRVAVASQ